MMIDPEDLTKHAPGLLGSLSATLWIRDTWVRRTGYVFAGWAASTFLTPDVASWFGVPEGSTGFIIGLFSMAIAARVFEAIETFDILARWFPSSKDKGGS